MKYILIALILFSCSKQTDSLVAPDPSISEITFDVPAGHFANEVYATKVKGNISTPGYYGFNGIKSQGELAVINISTDSLKVMTYHLSSGGGSNAMFSLNNALYGYIEQADYIDVTITSYINGVVNGTFTGRVTKAIALTPYTSAPTTISGTIKNAVVKFL